MFLGNYNEFSTSTNGSMTIFPMSCAQEYLKIPMDKGDWSLKTQN